MTDKPDIAIIGGGAAGLASAIFAAQTANGSRRILLLDGAKTLGAKILVSGGGRCNVTHDVVTPEDFNGSRPVVRNILAAFPASAAVEWFASMGVQLKREETGKLFPVANSARAVLDALLRRCDELKIEIRATSRVNKIVPSIPESPFFAVEYDGATIQATRIIMATGGRSLPRSGSDGSGWEIARTLGHTITPTFAALAPLVLDDRMFHASLAGIAQEVQLQTYSAGKLIDRRRGSLLWTHFGISGPVVMDASRHWIIPHESGVEARMECNLLPSENFESVEKWLIELASSRARATLANAITAKMPERVAKAIIIHAGIDPTIVCGQLSRQSRRQLVNSLTALPLPILRHRGWNYAEVTAGGVPLDEINYRTMESRKIPGLYLVGEMLDCDGRIGGFNFQWAWATGHLAGKAAGAPLPQ
jgi:predicted Rossmann fold flavoprotein